MWNPKLVNEVRSWMGQLFVWDQAEKQRIVRAAQAQGYGLPDEMYARPFPGSTPSNMTSVQQSKPALGTLAKLGIGAALAFGTGGAGLGAWSLMQGAAKTPAAVNTAEGFLIELEQSKGN